MMNYKRKKLLQIACITVLLLITASIMTNMPSKRTRTGKNAQQQKKVTAAALHINTSKPAAAGMAIPVQREASVQRETAAEDLAGGEDEYKEENPEKLKKIDALEKQIRELYQAKEKGKEELDVLLAAVKEERKKPKLTDASGQKKPFEIIAFELYLIRMLNEKQISLDASLKKKLKVYSCYVSGKNDCEGIAPD